MHAVYLKASLALHLACLQNARDRVELVLDQQLMPLLRLLFDQECLATEDAVVEVALKLLKRKGRGFCFLVVRSRLVLVRQLSSSVPQLLEDELLTPQAPGFET